MNYSNTLEQLHKSLQEHPLYKALNSIEDLQVFMSWHAFAVWDFMSLLKSLQNTITCTTLPWRPSPYPKDVVRFINEIVVGEESDSCLDGGYIDHFSMYVEAMKEVGAPVDGLNYVIETCDFSILPAPIRSFVEFNIGLAQNGLPHEVAAAFFYGRENLIPDIFEPIVSEINEKSLNCPNFKYYLERHIELDGGEHGHLAKKCLDSLTGHDAELERQAFEAAKTSLLLREKMWTYILGEIQRSTSKASLAIH
ncbi:DUF3050 domain-containing protein [Bacteriovorax sp. Seq25_V]|uniref:DUF3050 domain-containing protein n=1 Tax=Bacteriovorax sp. Seq25_V TaxID=1201288 RepID=UPI00038A5284|nr:DUF3050 domain-containing protein [Bacteriovorax sp. Seq25_V]EQC48050.1 PF11251 family protein [Bacteriovorax sp. Seq25_V]